MTDLNHKNKADERQTEPKAAEAVRDESKSRTSEQDERLTEAKATETVQDESKRRTSEQDEGLTETKAAEAVRNESTCQTSEQDDGQTKTAEAVQDEPAFTAPEQNGTGAGISSLMKAVAARIRNSTPQDGPLLSVDYVLRQLEAVHQDDAHISRAMDTLTAMEDGYCGDPGSPGNLLGQAKASAIRDIAVQRESTNLELIKFYEKLYDDLRSEACPPQPRKMKPQEIYDLIERNRLSGMNDEALHAELMAVLRESL